MKPESRIINYGKLPSIQACETSTNYELNEIDEKKGGLNSLNSSNSYAVDAPELSDKSLFGVARDIVRKIEPHTETHPAALLVQLLIGAGISSGAFHMSSRSGTNSTRTFSA